jgi:hypothetical protein
MEAMKECCGTCRFYLPANEEQGLCRRYPPQMTMANVKVRDKGRETEFTSQWQFPPMFAIGWCGEYKPKEG